MVVGVENCDYPESLQDPQSRFMRNTRNESSDCLFWHQISRKPKLLQLGALVRPGFS